MAKRGRNTSVGRSQSKFPSIRRSETGDRSGRRTSAPQLPEVVVVERFGSDEDGVPLVRPVSWPGPGPAPTFRLAETGLIEPFPMGARATARLVARETLVTGGVEDFPETLLKLFEGANTGKLILALGGR